MKSFDILVWIYKKDVHSAVVVAELCDTVLDRSGALLGRVRDAARNKEYGKVSVRTDDGTIRG